VLTPFQIASVGGTYSFDQATGSFTADGGSFGDPYAYNAPAVAGMPVSLSATQLAVPLANGNVAVLDAATGALQWTAVTGSTSAQSPALDATSFPVGTADGKVRAFPIAGCGGPTCVPTSTSSAAGAAISSQPVVAGGVVYVGTANGKLDAFDTAGVSLYSTTVDATASRVFVLEAAPPCTRRPIRASLPSIGCPESD
jgi:outer membrane protein assembly factor BamB